jgi:hypothetical protein
MDEHEVNGPADAAFFVANEVVNEYHSFPVVQRADIGGGNSMFMMINERWYQVSFTQVVGRRFLDRLDRLVEAAEDDDDDDPDYPRDIPRDELDYPHNQPPEY